MKHWKWNPSTSGAVIIPANPESNVQICPIVSTVGIRPKVETEWKVDGDVFRTTGPDGLEVALTVVEEPSGALRLHFEIHNPGGDALPMHELTVARLKLSGVFDRILLNGREMNSLSDLVKPDGKGVQSSCVAGFTDHAGRNSVVAGWEDPSEMFTWVTVEGAAGEPLIAHVWCDREGIALAPGGTLKLPPLLVLCGPDLWQGMRAYAAASGARCGAKPPAEIMTGWCSWYSYYGTESVDDILANARAFKSTDVGGHLKSMQIDGGWNNPIGDHVKVIQIDDGWNLPEPGAPRNWGDWQAGAKFPQGMKWIADEIRREGYMPGLWLAPFSVEPASNVFKEHPEWLVKDDGGNPKSFWGVYGLDLTHPGALDFVRRTFEQVFNEWGYEYIKIDFLLHAIQAGRRHDPTMTTAQALRRGLKTIREVAGDRFILGCGCPMGPALGIVDGMRIGPDVSHRWFLPMNLSEWPVGNCSIYSGAVHTCWRHWMHGLWWQNDPDCILVHDDGTDGERHEFGKWDGGVFAKEPKMGLSEEEAAFWIRMIWMTGGMGMVGESLANLTPERQALMAKVFPLNTRPVRWVGDYQNGRVVSLCAEDGPALVGLFNFTDTPQTVTLPCSDVGMKKGASRLVERLSGEVLEVSGDTIRFPELPPRSGRIWQGA